MTAKKFSFKAAAVKLLEQSDEPMTAKELAEQAIADGLISPDGKTPDATMAAQLYVDIKRNAKTPFKKVGKGTFALRQQTSSASSAELIIEQQNSLVQAALKKRLHDMDAYQFEFLIADLLQELGYENVEVTKQSGDKGIDVLADLTLEGITDVKTVVQVKRFKEGNNIPGSVVTQLRGSAEVDQRGLIITTSKFTKDAVAEAKAPNKMPVSLVDGRKLVDLLIKHKVGVKVEKVELYSVDSDYFENVEPDNGKAGNGTKNKGLWPLPGGTTAYVDTLFKFLAAVDAGVDTKQKLVTWIMREFNTVKKATTAGGYVTVPRAMGFTQTQGGKVILTPEGAEALASKDLQELYGTFAKNVLGVEEIIELLETSGEPQSEESVMEFLKENLDIDWSTFAQVTFRLNWLMNLGKIKKTPEGWVLTA